MGRYESQRAIAARTIYERRLSRKRGLQWLGWGLTRVTALSLTICAVLAVAWFAPTPAPAPEPAWTPVQIRDLNVIKAPVSIQPVRETRIEPRRGLHRRAAPAATGEIGIDPFEGAEILNLAELDAISQAH